MLDFTVNRQTCTRCGLCVADCPARIIAMADNGYPDVVPDKVPACYRCQHCLAICPTGALSILGLKPDDSRPLDGAFPDPEQLETLIKGRRSIRRYRQDNVEPALLQHLLEVAWHAPTGVNARDVLFTVVDDRGKLAGLRDRVMEGLARLTEEGQLPERFSFYGNFVKLWQEKRVDIIFRDAPHLVIATAPRNAASPLPDCLIALSYFELFAQANGVGTVWNGLAKWALADLLPETLGLLGIPGDHLFGYAMTFGLPAVQYVRTVQHGPASINRAPL